MSIFRVAVGEQTQNAGSGGTISNRLPPGYRGVANDLHIAVFAGQPNDTTEPDTPAGFTKRGSVLREVGAYDLRLVVFWRILAGGETANTTITFSSAVYSDGGVGTQGGVSTESIIYRGVDTTTPFDVADATSDAAAAATWTPPAITPVTPRALVVSVVSTSDTNALGLTGGSENGFTLAFGGANYDQAAGGEHAVGAADKMQEAPGLVTMCDWTQTVSPGDPWAGITMALRPATSAPSAYAAIAPKHTWGWQ